jgi:hypothetical protein
MSSFGIFTSPIGMIGAVLQKITIPIRELMICDSHQSLGLKTLIIVATAALWITSGSLGIDKYKDDNVKASIAKRIFALQIVIGVLIVIMLGVCNLKRYVPALAVL